MACDEALRVLFLSHDNPEKVAEAFINSLSEFIMEHKRKIAKLREIEREKNKKFLCDMEQEQSEINLYD